MSTRDIVIIGAGGFGREVLEWIADINEAKRTFNVLGFLDGNASLHGQGVNDVPVLGDIDWLASHPGVAATVAIGSPKGKRGLAAQLRAMGAEAATIVHPRAIVGRRVVLGPAAIVCPGSILTTEIDVGAFVTLNLDLTVGHDARIGDYCTLAPGVHVSGFAVIGEGCDIGTGASIVPGTNIGAWSIVGSGAVVSANLPPNCTAVGVPAKAIKTRPDGWHLG